MDLTDIKHEMDINSIELKERKLALLECRNPHIRELLLQIMRLRLQKHFLLKGRLNIHAA